MQHHSFFRNYPFILSYKATDVGSWSFVGSNFPVRNESTMKWYEIDHIWTADMKSSEAMILAVMNAIAIA